MLSTRRQFLQTAVLSAAVGPFACGENSSPTPSVIHYIESLRKPNGGWGWPEQFDSYLSVTFSVLGAYHLLGIPVPEPEKVVEFLLTYGHPLEGKGRQSRRHWAEPKFMTFQLMQSLAWLGGKSELTRFRSKVLSWKKPASYTAAYELGENPPLDQEAFPFLCRQLLGEPCDELREVFEPFFTQRQRPDGSFNSVPTDDEKCGGPGNVICTFRALQGLLALKGEEIISSETFSRTAEWFAACQREDGGFTHAPRPETGNVSDVYYAWCAIRGLKLLRREDLIKKAPLANWLHSLTNADGGFADRPGAASNPLTLYYALDLMNGLFISPLAHEQHETAKNHPAETLDVIPANHHVYTIQFEAPGSGSVSDVVMMAKRLQIHLWGAKNSTPEWIDAAQKTAREQGVPVTFFPSDEHYGSVKPVPGYGRFTHLDDPFEAPPCEEETAQQKFQIWQACDHEPAGRLLLDEAELHGGYDLIAAFHFGCWNFVATMPYLKRYERSIPLTALQDSHGEAWWWREQLTAFRTLFVAENPTWKGWLDALKRKRVAAVRKDQWTQDRLRILGGSPAVRKFLTDHESEWKWWDEFAQTRTFPKNAVSVQFLPPGAPFEPGAKPDAAVLRIRTNLGWIENKVLVPVGPEMEIVRAQLDDGRELTLRRDLRILDSPDYLKGCVDEDSTYADLPTGAAGVSITFREDGREFISYFQFPH
ncbi:MAG: prenyltransferase/squalene oxidase repeat-containing protein [Thermoguttaceae bacterium]|nr:prenyltransferase/squalene oxidase repeat-containing protein [Thermoguttaceae bacterium]